ncbi:hypothetical protein [Paenibacillus polysaccharolyticus]|uniref:hypothetical protein n=1 Tax=Paenibacillus polysaccharolyticus TaxID=582692 RepID=UPI0012B9AC70|nr:MULTISPECIES: hypothetical protein [Paenibacillus]
MKKRSDAWRIEHIYCMMSKRLERRALLFIGLLLILVILCQLLLLVPDLKKIMTTIDRLEGTPVHMQSNSKDRNG